jgi:hypothetical protein
LAASLRNLFDSASLSSSSLLYVSAGLPSRVLQALVDSGASINLIHEQLSSFLSLPVTACQGPKVSLADGATVLSCSGIVQLSYCIANVSMQHTLFVANIGVQSMILGMPFLEKENPDIDWVVKSLTWRTKSPSPPASSPSPPPPLPVLPPTPRSPASPVSPPRAPRSKSPYPRDTRRSSRSKPRSQSRSNQYRWPLLPGSNGVCLTLIG